MLNFDDKIKMRIIKDTSGMKEVTSDITYEKGQIREISLVRNIFLSYKMEINYS